MAQTRIRTVDFLPEIFRTPTNRQFLSATLDQLVQDPKLKPTQGFIGRRVGPGVNPKESYVLEPTKTRTDYQLEPGVVFLKPNTNTVESAVTYPGLVDSIKVKGGNTTRQDRLWESEYYSWDPFVDLDKFINFSQYYWLPAGPDSVDVFAAPVPLTDDFTVTRNSADYTFSGVPGTNPTITLVRQGSYDFNVQQNGHNFWIQAVPGTSGVLPQTPNQSSREVLGVINNGEDNGTITFNVPAKSAQNFYYQLEDSGTVDFATSIQFDDINNVYVSEFIERYGGIDGVKDLNGRTVIFLSNAGWFFTGLYDSAGQPYDSVPFDETVEISLDSQRYSVWRINYVFDDALNPYIRLTVDRPVNNLSRLLVLYGNQYANISFYKNSGGLFEQIPLITANLDTLYYQDANNPELFGIIKLVDQSGDQDLDIDEIIGQKNYTSPNGVIFSNGLKIQFQGPTTPTSYEQKEYYVEGVGTAIELVPVTELITPETYTRSSTIPYDSTPYDATPFDDTLNAPVDQDYITINRASKDLNAWTRSNRWFHVDIINATAQYNNTVPFLDNNARAKRPVLEFVPGLKLFDFGTQGIAPINIIDFRETDAMSNINGSIGYSVDGYSFATGSRVIFAADRDPEVRNKIYQVTFIEPSGGGTPIIDLQPANLNKPDEPFDVVAVCLSGITLQGQSFWFNNETWIPAQQKSGVNQAPLFDVYDAAGYSFSDGLIYPSTSFRGTKLFSYAPGEGVTDKIIGQPLKYLTINNVGDIVFDNNLYIDTFVYVEDTISVEKSIGEGFVRQYVDRVNFEKLIGWETANSTVVSRQSFSFTYTNEPLVIDIPVSQDSATVPVKVYVNAVFLTTDNYTYEVTSNSTIITFINPPALDSSIEVTVVSDVASPTGFYTVPLNLENNPLNDQVTTLTLGTIRNYYNGICQNISAFTGEINGINNTRDLGNLIPYGDQIIQNSAPVLMTAVFTNNTEYDFFQSLEFTSYQYQKFKNVLVDTVIKNDFQNMTVAEILDACITQINFGKTEMSPFYWSDMLPSGETYKETVYTVTPITTDTFDTLYSYNLDSANYQAILVYLNNELLIGDGIEYEVAVDGPRVTILVPLAVGDVVSIREYENTFGNYVPTTPTKMGMYPAFIPEKFLDTTYITPTEVIRGHDGSITVAYQDIRDDILLEFEKRIYDNLKVERLDIPLTYADVAPGQFRTTDYTQEEITTIMGTSFLAWVGANKLPYKDQEYDPTNQFTWNYSASLNKLNNETLLGAWRGIYNYFYDTDAPNTRPWEMLGFSERPAWWEEQYGPAPYTSGNLVLWEDLEAGRVMDPVAPYIIPKYRRPGLTAVIPSDSEGNLLSPYAVMVGEYDPGSFRKSWTVGDDGPVENAWRTSSAWPFAVQRLLALTKPAKYFTYYIDRDAYRFNEELGQWVYFNRTRTLDIDSTGIIQVYGNGISKNSYLNWVVDYNKVIGKESTTALSNILDNLDVRLCYRMAAFSDKQYIKLFTEKSSPNSLNTSLLLPDESYQLLLYKNPTIASLTWSSVIIQKSELGYTVYGYSTTKPYFEIRASIPNGNYRTITVADTVVRVPNDYSNTVVQVPYGYEFVGVNSVVDFLLSYGAFMDAQGMTFEDQERGRILNWSQMAQEFVYWSKQGWAVGSLININPVANILQIVKPGLIAEPLSTTSPEDILLNQNKQPLQGLDYVVDRYENAFQLTAVNNNAFSYLNAKFTAYENLIVLDNTSIFNDLIYDPTTGARQSRLLFTGYTTYEWNGSLDAQGFILNQDNIQDWIPNKSYTKGQIVKYKDSYWSAVKIIPPQEKFDFQFWLKSDYAEIQKGLLPNAATKAQFVRGFYDTNQANLERDADLLSFGLIGFRPRRYMQNLNLDDISQVNLYQQFLGVKGTTQATDIFTKANLGKEVAEYEIFENWAIQRAIYGANANRSYYELRLNQALLQGNPSTIQVIEPQQYSIADQTVQVSQLWKESYPITSPDILPTTFLNSTDVQLPTAGYVNWDDADIKLFDFAELTTLINNIENIQVGTSVWVAKDNSYDWNIYRNNLVLHNIVQVRDNLNDTCTLRFANQHGLTKDQQIVVKYFGQGVDGAYRVLSVPSLDTITVALTLGGAVTQLTGIGVCFVLESMRVAQAADVSNLVYANSLLPGNRAWVDDDGTGHWVVYEKINPFTPALALSPLEPLINSRYGSAITQGFGGFGALVGAPGLNNNVGGVYGFTKGGSLDYVETLLLAPGANNFENFGSAVTSGGNQWGAVGAANSWAKQGYAVTINRNNNSGDYLQSQLLTEIPYRIDPIISTGTSTYSVTGVTLTDPSKVSVVVNDVVLPQTTAWIISGSNIVFQAGYIPTAGKTINVFNYDEYSYSINVSNDERWLYIGAPEGNRVYAYNRVDVQSQVKNFIGDGTRTDFYVADVIIVDDDSSSGGIGSTQIGVTVNNIPKTAGVDFDYVNGTVIFDTAPNTDDKVRVIRLLSNTYFPTEIPAGSFISGKQYQITATGSTNFISIGASSNAIGTVFTANGPGTGTGTAAIMNFDIDMIYPVTDIYSFSVYVNSVLQRPNMDYSFNGTTKTITFVNTAPLGTVLINCATHFKYIDYIDSAIVGSLTTGARFGHSLTSTTDGRQFTAGAPNATANSKLLAGQVFQVDRSVERFTVTDTAQTQYQTLRNFNGPATVKVNATFLIPDAYNNNGQFTEVNANTVNITAPLNVGDIVEIETNTFKLMQAVSSNVPQAGALFGTAIDQCPTNCSLYIGQPNDSNVVPEAGSVERFVNQSRLYGIITGTSQSPTLTPGDTIRINQVDIAVPTPATWSSGVTWSSGSYVIYNSAIYKAVRAVPVSVSISDTTYWIQSSWLELYANTINVAAQPNNIGLIEIPNAQATVSNGYLTISVLNANAATPFTQLTILPGLGNAFYDIGFNTQYYTQTIQAPGQLAYAHFGAAIDVSDDALTLVVGSPQGTAFTPTTFDNGTTYFDSRSTEYFDPLNESGVAYTYDFLAAANESIYNPGKFVFGQQIYDDTLASLDEFGTAVSYSNGIMLVGAPQDDLNDSSGDYGRVAKLNNADRSPAWKPVYIQTPIVDVNLVNSVFMYDRLESKVTQYFDFIDPLQGKILGAAKQNIDYLGAVDPAAYNTGDINNYGDTWVENHLGEIWWDLSTVRFIDYHQGTIDYASRRWGQLFPGSTVDVYQWIESPTPPATYQGPGTVYSTTSYTVSSKLDALGTFVARYYFWVKGIPEVASKLKKTLSVQAIAQYIENPRSSGISYVAFINPSTTAIYNGRNYISAQDTILNIEFDKIANNDNVHIEYDLISAGNPDSFLQANLYRKMLDSFCGEDTLGNKVPDTTLSPADLYGVQFRPRQSFFVDRFLALQNYLERANAIMAQYPLSDSRSFALLNSSEPEPTSASGEWNKRVLTYQELTFQDLSEVPVGYKYLVASDATNDGLWTIYTVGLGNALLGAPKELLLTRVQNYDTKLYWEYIDWIQPGYNAGVKPIAEVATYNELLRLTIPNGSSAKVTRNSFGKFEIYQYLDSQWIRVVLEDGTVRIKETIWDYAAGKFGFDVETFDSQYFDQFPGTETRQIIKAINEQLLIDELAIFRNSLLLLVFEFILTEQIAPDWLFKTSLIDVNHKIRDLLPYQIFRQDNQDFVLDYIKEVKPYHVKIKEFNLRYEGIDTYDGNITDFDCPAYYNTNLQEFLAPALDDTDPPKYSNSVPSSDPIWYQTPWDQWYQNYTLQLQGADVIEPGVGYTVPPEITVGVEWQPSTAVTNGEQIFYQNYLYTVLDSGTTGTVGPTFTSGTATNGTATLGFAGLRAKAVSRINTAGQLVEVIVIVSGSGYIVTPTMAVSGGNGVGARVVPVLGNELVRNMLTVIKYDRYNYVSQVVDWQTNTNYTQGQLIRFQNNVYSTNSAIDSGSIFDPEQYTIVDESTLDAADRVVGLYTPTPNEPGRELAQVITGIDYPGVQVMGPNFNQNTGYDVGNFDINPYDNIDYGPEGRPTYSESILDAVYESAFTDTYLGTRPTDINIDGGAFIDTYSSHAPEELVPGTTFDTLDFRVYTRPGADWEGNGHGFNLKSVNLAYTTSTNTVSFVDAMAHAIAVRVVNVTNRVSLTPLVDYTVDWPTQTVTVINGASDGDLIEINVYGIGGGSQLYKESYPGEVVENNLTIPVITAVNWQPSTTYAKGSYVRYLNNVYRTLESIFSGSTFNPAFYLLVDAGSVLNELLVVVNGEIVTNYTYAPSANKYETVIAFDDTYSSSDWVVITVLGQTTPAQSWSYPLTQYLPYLGSTYTLSNSLQGTNDINLIVERNGQRLRPAESIEYIGNGSSVGPYYLPTRGETPQGLIADNDVVVYIDQVRQNLSVDYTVSPWDGSSDRYVEFATAPAEDATIVIAVTTDADYTVNNDVLTLRVGAAADAVIAVTTWNDTNEQDILTQVFQGPTQTGITVGQPYDTTDFDVGTVTGDPGSFDYTAGTVVQTNNFDTGRPIVNAERLWVTLNGWRLVAGQDFTVSGSVVTVGGSIIGQGDVVVITSFTMSVVPEAISFRIFQDMLGNQKIYRIIRDNTTVLTQALSESDDVIYVDNASRLSQPNTAANIFGQLTINGERITYRNRDVVANTVSGLRRGTAGTAIDSHSVGSVVTDIGRGDMLPARYQKTTLTAPFIGDGVTTTYTTELTYNNDVVTTDAGTVQVYIGATLGTLAELPQSSYTVTSIEPVAVTLNFVPVAGLLVRVQYISPTSVVTNTDISTTGSSATFETLTIASAEIIDPADYTVSTVSPVTVIFDTAPAAKQIVQIGDSNSLTFFVGNGTTSTYVTEIELGRAVQVKVGGTLLDQSQYDVLSVNPVTVELATAPANTLEIDIFIQQALVMYAPGAGTPSNGRPLQEQPTLAAWFIEGRV